MYKIYCREECEKCPFGPNVTQLHDDVYEEYLIEELSKIKED
jgi:hypothetical protein